MYVRTYVANNLGAGARPQYEASQKTHKPQTLRLDFANKFAERVQYPRRAVP